MFDKYLIQTRGFRNIRENGEVVGVEFGLKISYYRGVALAILAALSVRIDGEEVEPSAIRLVVGDRIFTLDEAAAEESVRWEFGVPIGVRIMRSGGLRPGPHHVAVEQQIKPAYMPPQVNFVGAAEKTMTLVDPALQPAFPNGMTLGVSLYSYQEEFYTRAMDLQDCLAEVSAIGARGVQLIAEQMMPGYPEPTADWLRQWRAGVERYGLAPTLMDTFVDVNCGGHRQMSVDEGVAVLVRQMELAKTLGFSLIRPTTGPVESAAPELIARALPHAERLDVAIAPEIHAPIELTGPYIESYLDLIEKTGTGHLGFTLDLGIFCREMPLAICEQAIRNGAQPELVAYIADAYRRDLPHAEVLDHVRSSGGTHAAIMLAFSSHYFGPPRNRVEDLQRIMPFVKNVHGKFYVMSEHAEEPAVPYDEIIPALLASGYSGSIDSEYEGQRLTQDAFVTDSCEQVRRHHSMLCKIIAATAV